MGLELPGSVSSLPSFSRTQMLALVSFVVKVLLKDISGIILNKIGLGPKMSYRILDQTHLVQQPSE